MVKEIEDISDIGGGFLFGLKSAFTPGSKEDLIIKKREEKIRNDGNTIIQDENGNRAVARWDSGLKKYVPRFYVDENLNPISITLKETTSFSGTGATGRYNTTPPQTTTTPSASDSTLQSMPGAQFDE